MPSRRIKIWERKTTATFYPGALWILGEGKGLAVWAVPGMSYRNERTCNTGLVSPKDICWILKLYVGGNRAVKLKTSEKLVEFSAVWRCYGDKGWSSAFTKGGVFGTQSSQWKPGGIHPRKRADQRRLTQVKTKEEVNSFPLRELGTSKDACSFHFCPTLSQKSKPMAIMQENTWKAK